MQEIWIRIFIRENGSIARTESFTREQVKEALLVPKRVRKPRTGAFAVTDEDKGDVLYLKHAVFSMGGVTRLAYKLGLDRGTVYQWLRNGKISDQYRDQVREIGGTWIFDDEGD